MSVIEGDVLRAIGAMPTGLRVPIPLYMRVKFEQVPSGLNGMLVTRAVPTNLSFQQLSGLILEIPDYYKLLRYVVYEN